MNKVLSVLIAAGVAMLSLLAPTAASAAPAVPWTDSNAIGYIGFCNAQNHQIRSGSTTSFPFVVKAVSSTAAPAGYGYPNGRAVLYAYQPIQYVDPGDWSGKLMTGATKFSNDKAPMAVGLPGDPSLLNFSQAYPLHWEGFAQIRMFYTAINTQAFINTYPAANIYVSGTKWTQVGGGTVNCTAGQALSDESDLKVAHRQLTQGGQSKGASPAGASTGASTSGGGTGAAGSTPGSGSSSGGATSDASNGSKSSSSDTGLIAGIIIAVIVLGSGGYFVVRRRQAGPPASAE